MHQRCTQCGCQGSMVFHKVVQALDRAPVEARAAAGLFDKPTESIVIATWSGACMACVAQYRHALQLDIPRNVIRQQLRNFERGSMGLISHRKCSEKIAVELATHATPRPRTCEERNIMHQKMCPICIWLPEAHWSFTKCCRLTSGLKCRLDQQLVSLTGQLRVV